MIAEKGDAEWTAKIGSLIKEMKADGTLGKLTTKWYGKDYSAGLTGTCGQLRIAAARPFALPE